MTLPDGKSTSRQHGAGDGKRPQGTADQDRGQHERARRFQLPRPGRASQGGSGRQNPVLGLLGGLERHAGGAAGKGHGRGAEAGGEGSGEATGAEAAFLAVARLRKPKGSGFLKFLKRDEKEAWHWLGSRSPQIACATGAHLPDGP